ncbi:unnamed protein product [Chondrus crispus]|uniref:Uncharacterized protein n=1 Tax=Chondrus crispus TaxID=2769 RepID=R7QNI3_CHOCR|nr:unnamed protein product [Chondrus crispus]XP_005714729.1 unnamed protein product [Chondrus crispus]CDF34910.1 unnamed protein product [Chondrus crispus]CDF40052.1 unnamed protein product [Chondrus crispus]|eukprot:XP_005710346.1 unnamed protein product [Chondrus crispus]
MTASQRSGKGRSEEDSAAATEVVLGREHAEEGEQRAADDDGVRDRKGKSEGDCAAATEGVLGRERGYSTKAMAA